MASKEEVLEERGRFWQKVLRLQDWSLFFEWQRSHEMQCEQNEAQIDYRHRHKSAKILIREEIDYPPDCWRPFDLDRMVVHELLHLSMVDIPGLEHPSDDHQERFVEVLSTQIVALWRGEFNNGSGL